jgi:hypothetical protein
MRFKLLKMNIKKITLLVLNKIKYIFSSLYLYFEVDRLLKVKADYIDIVYLKNIVSMKQLEGIQNI